VIGSERAEAAHIPAASSLRVVMFVRTDVTHDSRVLREAATLAAAGHDVTVIGRTGTGAGIRTAEPEERDGFRILRLPVPVDYQPWWRWARAPWRVSRFARERWRDRSPGLVGAARAVGGVAVALLALVPLLALAAPPAVRRRLARVPVRQRGDGAPGAVEWLVRWWFGTMRWAAAAARIAPPADVYHGHDLSGLPAAAAAARRHGGLVVYDSHELFLESGANADQPGWAKGVLARLERRLARSAVALVTVNATLGELLSRRLGIDRVVVVHNAPPRWAPPAEAVPLLHDAAAIPPGARIVLYHGAFTADRGLLQLVEAMADRRLEGAHLVLLGNGPLEAAIRARALELDVVGRVHLLPPVPPQELPEWVASADVAAMPNLPRTANERLSTPNKLFESLAVGLPVVSSDFPERRRIIADDPDGPLGALCDPTSPSSIAAAIASILDLPPDAHADLRARCLGAAHARWNWETESARLVALYGELAAAGAARRGH